MTRSPLPRGERGTVKRKVLFYFYCFKFTGLETHPTPSRFLLVNLEGDSFFFFGLCFTTDRLNRTGLGTPSTHGAYIGKDPIFQKSPANLRWTSLVDDMFFIFIPKIPDGREDWIGGRSSQGTEGSFCRNPSQLFKKVDMIRGSPSLRDLCQELVHPLRSFPAGSALSTGLILQKVHKVFSYIHHTGGLIHHNHSTRTHHRTHFGESIEVDGQIDQRLGNAST